MWPFDIRARREQREAEETAQAQAAEQAAEQAKALSTTGAIGQYAFWDPEETPGTADHPWAYENITWVYSCVHAIGDAAASVPLVFRDKDGEPVSTGVIPELFTYVNDGQDQGMLKRDTASDNALHGNALWHIVRDSRGGPLSLRPLPPHNMGARVKGNELTYVESEGSGDEKIYNAEDVIHFREYQPKHTFWGMSAIEAMAIAIDADRAAELFNRNFLRNGAMPSAALIAAENLSPQQKEELRERAQERWGGTKNAGKLMVLSGMGEGGFNFLEMGKTPREAQFIELRKMNRDQILAAFGVPRILLGITDGVNYANADIQRKLFWSDTMRPKLRMLAATINEALVPKLGDTDGLTTEFDLGSVEALQPDYRDRAETGAKMISSGQFTPNQVREMLHGLPVVEGQPGLDTYYMAANYLPIAGDVSAEKEEAEAEAEAEREAQERMARVEAAVERIAESVEKARVAALPRPPVHPPSAKAEPQIADDGAEARKLLWKQRQEEREPDVRALGETVSRVWRKFTDEVVENLEAEDKKGLKQTLPSPDVVLFDLDKAGDLAVLEMTAEELAAYERAGNATVDLFGLSTPFDATTPGGQEWAAETAKRIRTLPETYHDEIRGVIGRAYEEGQTLSEVRYAVEEFYKEQYGDWNTPGAQRIAITEANGAASNATVEAYKQNGVERIRWLHSHAPLEPRPTHKASDGQEREFGKVFATADPNRKGTHDLRWPHDDKGGPADNIWCRCDTAPVVE